MPVEIYSPADIPELSAALRGLKTTLANPHKISHLPVSNFMPSQGVEFRYHGGQTIPAIGGTINVVQFTVPKGLNGIINRLANVVNGPGYQDFAGTTTWSLFTDIVSGTLAPNFASFNGSVQSGAITASLGQISNPSILNGIRIRESQVVTLQFNNVALAVAGQIIGGLLGGFFYPVSLEPVMGF